MSRNAQFALYDAQTKSDPEKIVKHIVDKLVVDNSRIH